MSYKQSGSKNIRSSANFTCTWDLTKKIEWDHFSAEKTGGGERPGERKSGEERSERNKNDGGLRWFFSRERRQWRWEMWRVKKWEEI